MVDLVDLISDITIIMNQVLDSVIITINIDAILKQ